MKSEMLFSFWRQPLYNLPPQSPKPLNGNDKNYPTSCFALPMMSLTHIGEPTAVRGCVLPMLTVWRAKACCS